MLKWKRVICSVCLLVFILIPLPISAAEVDLLNREELLAGQVLSFDEGLDLFINNELILPSSSFGSVQDETGATAFDVRFYSGLFGWSTEESFAPSASIGYTKLFTNAEYFSNLKNVICKTWDTLRSDILPVHFNDFWGYTITLVRDDVDYIAEGTKIELDLVLADKGQADNDLVGDVIWRTSNGVSYQNGTREEGISNDNLADFVWQDVSNGCPYFTNVITVYGYDYDTGDIVTLGSVSDVTGISQAFKAPVNISNIVIDVCYSVYDVNGNSGYPQVIMPLMYTANISGTIALDESGVISGLISGIVEWLRSILNAILDLPNQIVVGIQNVLTTLFIPSAEDMAGVYENAKGLLEDRLGFIAQIVAWILELFDTLAGTVTDTQDTITVPRLALPWPSDLPAFAQVAGNEIVIWEEFTFDIIPEGMDSLRNLLETVTSLWAVLALVMCCVDSYHGFVGESSMYRTSMEYQNTKDIAEEITGFRRKEHFGRRRW